MADKKLEVFVITPDATEREKYKFHGQADMAILHCLTGDIGILPGRVACSAILGEGALRILDNDIRRKVAVLGGVFHFEDDILTLITQKALLPGEVDIMATQSQVQELESRIISETKAGERDKLRSELRRCKIMLDVAAG